MRPPGPGRRAAAAARYLQRRDACRDGALRGLLGQLAAAQLSALLAEDEESGASAAAAVPLEVQRLTEDLLILRVARPQAFSFAPGQSARLRVGAVSRRYSLACAADASWLEFFIELRAGSAMGEQLRRLQAGTAVSVGAVKGDFALAPAAHHHLMVATVTGIAPFMSMLRSQPPADARFTILHGASYCDEFGYAPELERLAAASDGRIRYLPTVSRPAQARNRAWRGLCGRIEAHLPALLGALRGGGEAAMVYACGHPQMVSEAARLARAAGLPVRTEPY